MILVRHQTENNFTPADVCHNVARCADGGGDGDDDEEEEEDEDDEDEEEDDDDDDAAAADDDAIRGKTGEII